MNWALLHPKTRLAFQYLEQELVRQKMSGEMSTLLSPFMVAGSKTAWDDPARYGLALEFRAQHREHGWIVATPTEYADLHRTANQRGLLWSADAPGVITHPLWLRVRNYLT